VSYINSEHLKTVAQKHCSYKIEILIYHSSLYALKQHEFNSTTTLKLNIIKTKLNSMVLSPRANYTDWTTAACRRSDCQLLRIKGATWSAWRIPTAGPYSRFSRQEPLLFCQVAPQLYSRGWVDPVPDPLLFFFWLVPGIEPGPPDL
jgi:hypothetical protein